jgi:hypothetical protein
LYTLLLSMLALIQRQKKKLGLSEEIKKFRITQFPFTTIIKEIHLIGVGFMSKPITKKHERFVKVLNEHEVYIYKSSRNNCYACQDLYGRVKKEYINQDPFLSQAFFWKSE